MPIKIKENKRFYISQNGQQGKTILVSCEKFYCNIMNDAVKVTKKGKSFNTKQTPLNISIAVSALKKKDVLNLMNSVKIG